MNRDVIVEEIMNSNSPKYNLEKAVEECLELAEVLMKKVLKEGGPKEPIDQAIIDEIGDVQIRLNILGKIFGEQAVRDRVDYKLNMFANYLKEGKYVGTI